MSTTPCHIITVIIVPTDRPTAACVIAYHRAACLSVCLSVYVSHVGRRRELCVHPLPLQLYNTAAAAATIHFFRFSRRFPGSSSFYFFIFQIIFQLNSVGGPHATARTHTTVIISILSRPAAAAAAAAAAVACHVNSKSLLYH